MAFRKPDTLLPLEQQILDVVLASGADGVHGFALAQQIADAEQARRILSHGTLYKALDRLHRRGLVAAAWEDEAAATAAGRPPRRLYSATATTERVLAAARASSRAARLGEAPA